MSKAKAEPRAKPKRFYMTVEVQQIGDEFAITLDGKTIKTPMKKNLAMPSFAMAENVAAEWRAQDAVIDTDTMPLTRLVNITLDRISLDRDALLSDLSGYAETDLVCYRAPHMPSSAELGGKPSLLRVRQDMAFDPLLQWIASEFSVHLAITDGLMPIVQNTADVAKIAARFAAANDAELAALAMLVPMLGSAVIALALYDHKIDVETALSIARLDEDFQAEQWGIDIHVAREWEAKKRDIRAAVFYLQRCA